jgi:phosphatidylinositol kinase/protein kinase (PI-3  family)
MTPSFPVTTSIQRYAVIPLSTNSGLIGWVPHCDTLHALIRDYREKKKILLNIEHRIMLRVCAAAMPTPLSLWAPYSCLVGHH